MREETQARIRSRFLLIVRVQHRGCGHDEGRDAAAVIRHVRRIGRERATRAIDNELAAEIDEIARIHWFPCEAVGGALRVVVLEMNEVEIVARRIAGMGGVVH